MFNVCRTIKRVNIFRLNLKRERVHKRAVEVYFHRKDIFIFRVRARLKIIIKAHYQCPWELNDSDEKKVVKRKIDNFLCVIKRKYDILADDFPKIKWKDFPRIFRIGPSAEEELFFIARVIINYLGTERAETKCLWSE